MRLRIYAMLSLLTLASVCAANPTDEITVRDLPSTNGNWQEGSAVVPASATAVRGWLTDYRGWPEHFSDIEWSEVLGDDAAGRHVVRFRSKIAGRTMTVHEAVTPELLTFEGDGHDVHTQGRIWLLPVSANATRVIMQSTSEVHGFLGLFATRGLKRRRAFEVIRADLGSLLQLARH